ncbi:hypothetical protein AL00_15995 [Sphingobium indicum F2]|uniref:Uncharacterized protein n=1 Tax=Sphingobium indicum F2 TaxID=1450518 RepID=A0A8E1C1Z5_9SPHN|nr:hypothetical protein AL00_15995 [Sphingobium indicum F2]
MRAEARLQVERQIIMAFADRSAPVDRLVGCVAFVKATDQSRAFECLPPMVLKPSFYGIAKLLIVSVGLKSLLLDCPFGDGRACG